MVSNMENKRPSTVFTIRQVLYTGWVCMWWTLPLILKSSHFFFLAFSLLDGWSSWYHTIFYERRKSTIITKSFKFTEKQIQLYFVSVTHPKMASSILLSFKYWKEKKYLCFLLWSSSKPDFTEGWSILFLSKFLLWGKAEVINQVLSSNILTNCPTTWAWGFEKVWFIALSDCVKAMLMFITQAYCHFWRVLKYNLL